ncbi:MAG: ABC transporter ATP-binding protein [Pyrinomonadaceae bacterium]
MNGTQSALSADKISKSYGRHSVLNDVSFEMLPGEIIGIVGENGAGKSTLLKILVGLLLPSSGSVSADGLIGYCPQELAIFESMTVTENIRYFATAYGLSNGWVQRADDLIHRFNFADHRDRPVASLSGGTKQKLNLTLGLLHAPRILILDEPYSGFDWETYLRFWEFAEIQRSIGNCTLIVSHLINDRAKFDRIYSLREGVLECE